MVWEKTNGNYSSKVSEGKALRMLWEVHNILKKLLGVRWIVRHMMDGAPWKQGWSSPNNKTYS